MRRTCERLDAARRRRIETLSFKSALEDDGKDDVNQDATQDEIDGLGVWLPGDEFKGTSTIARSRSC